jgi:hypothetical protein
MEPHSPKDGKDEKNTEGGMFVLIIKIAETHVTVTQAIHMAR